MQSIPYYHRTSCRPKDCETGLVFTPSTALWYYCLFPLPIVNIPLRVIKLYSFIVTRHISLQTELRNNTKKDKTIDSNTEEEFQAEGEEFVETLCSVQLIPSVTENATELKKNREQCWYPWNETVRTSATNVPVVTYMQDLHASNVCFDRSSLGENSSRQGFPITDHIFAETK